MHERAPGDFGPRELSSSRAAVRALGDLSKPPVLVGVGGGVCELAMAGRDPGVLTYSRSNDKRSDDRRWDPMNAVSTVGAPSQSTNARLN